MTSDTPKPGFMDGLLSGMAEKNKKPDSPELDATKSYIETMNLSMEDRMALSGWLLSEAVKSTFADALGDLFDD